MIRLLLIGSFCTTSPPLLGLEDLVHDIGAGRDHRTQLAPVDDFGTYGPMPTEASGPPAC